MFSSAILFVFWTMVASILGTICNAIGEAWSLVLGLIIVVVLMSYAIAQYSEAHAEYIVNLMESSTSIEVKE